MATFTSAQSGLWSATTTWAGGVVPPNAYGDNIIISVSSTATSRLTTAAGFAAGSTVIAIQAGTGTIAAGDCVRFPGDTTYYRVTVGVPAGAGNITITPALVNAIPAVATNVEPKGHVVEYDIANGFYGNDTATPAIVANGTLLFSRTVNTAITTRGNIDAPDTVVAGVDCDQLTSGVTTTVTLNSSAAMANFKYGMFIANSANVIFRGKFRRRHTVTTTALAATNTTFDVADATGWEVGDIVILGASNSDATQTDERTISTITPLSGTAATIVVSAGMTFSHALGVPIMNRSSNVTVQSFNTTNPGFMCFRITSVAANGRKTLENIQWINIGSNSANPNLQGFISMSGGGFLSSAFTKISALALYNCNQASQNWFINGFFTNKTTFAIEDCAFFNASGPAATILPASGSSVRFENLLCLRQGGSFYQGAFSQGPQDCIFNNCNFWATTGNLVQHTNGATTFNNCIFNIAPSFTTTIQLGSGRVTFNNCNLMSSSIPGTRFVTHIIDATTNFSQEFNVLFTDCVFGTPSTSFYTNIGNTAPSSVAVVANKNKDPLQNEVYSRGGTVFRDTTGALTGVTNTVRLSPNNASTSLTTTRGVAAVANVPQFVTGKVKRDNANPLTVTISGIGFSPVTYTCTAAPGVEETYSLQFTAPLSQVANLTFSTIGSSGNAWVGNHAAPPSAAINTGIDEFWSSGRPSSLIVANFTSAGDVWNSLKDNYQVPGTMGKQLKDAKDKAALGAALSG